MIKFHPPYEPKKNNRFLVNLPDFFEIPEYLIKSFERPSIKIINEPTGESYMDWKIISLEIYDIVNPSTSHKIWNLIKALEGNDDKLLELAEKIKRFDIKLQLLGPIGDTVEEWELKVQLVEILFGDLNNEDDNVTNITLRLKPLMVKLNY